MLYTSKTAYHGFTRGKVYEAVMADKEGITFINEANVMLLVQHAQMRRLFEKAKEGVFNVKIERLSDKGIHTVEDKVLKRSSLTKYLGAFMLLYKNVFEVDIKSPGETKLEFYGEKEVNTVCITYSVKTLAPAKVIELEPDSQLLLTYKKEGVFLDNKQ